MDLDHFIEKYSDYSIVLMDLLNSDRKFSFSLSSERAFLKMLRHEDINYIVMSNSIVHTFRHMAGWDFVIVDINNCFYYENVVIRIENRLQDSSMLLIDRNEKTIHAKIIEE